MFFASDNTSGIAPKIMTALQDANRGFMAAYSNDALTRRLKTRMAEVFEHDVEVFLCTSGTIANALSVAHFCSPGAAVVCRANAHLAVDEAAAAEFFSHGAKLITMAGRPGGKLDADELLQTLGDNPREFVHSTFAAVVSLTQASEEGDVYSAGEIRTLAAIAKAHNVTVHMDGARFANALSHTDATPAQMTWKAGVDVLSLGATKNGAMIAEAIVFFDRDKARGFDYRHKQAGQLASKSRFIAAQFLAWFEDDYWLELAGHANAMGARLRTGLKAIDAVRIPWAQHANEVFCIMGRDRFRALSDAGVMCYAPPIHNLPRAHRPQGNEALVRFVASWSTQPDHVDDVLRLLRASAS